jgi:hypothetical protein
MTATCCREIIIIKEGIVLGCCVRVDYTAID